MQSSSTEREAALAQRDVKLQEYRQELENLQRTCDDHLQQLKVKDSESAELQGRLNQIHETMENAGVVREEEKRRREMVSASR